LPSTEVKKIRRC